MSKPKALKILYLVHDLYDPAVIKRITMLQKGGAEVTLAGFRRMKEPAHNIGGCSTLNFGQTYNAKFLQRLLSVIRQIIFLKKYRTEFVPSDIIIARNLEMLTLGVRGRSLCNDKPILIYESLDIHRLLLRQNIIGKILRKLEGWLAKRASALITSSPAFIREYFDSISEVKLPVKLIENKVLNIDEKNNLACDIDTVNILPKPWKIGWFGAIRCRKSLEILTELVRRSNGNIEVIIRGRPALDQFDDFYRDVSGISGLKFLGEYKNPDDLKQIYSEVHFTWAIDMFEEGLNSSWLLPNRLYEGCFYGSVPIADAAVETGQFISNLGIGVTIKDKESKIEYLTNFFSSLTEKNYCIMRECLVKIPKSKWAFDIRDCKEVVVYFESFYKVKGAY